jgi:hypothetical protein
MWPITAMTGGLGVRAIMALFHHKNDESAIRKLKISIVMMKTLGARRGGS